MTEDLERLPTVTSRRGEGIPAGPETFRERLEAAHGFVIASPEYNASMPGVLKNGRLGIEGPIAALQRTSRPPAVGVTVDGWRQPGPLVARSLLEHLGARIYLGMSSLAQGRVSHEVASFGYWPGPRARRAFYACAYPEPPGYRSTPITPSGAQWDKGLGEFVLPYEDVRTAPAPDTLLL